MAPLRFSAFLFAFSFVNFALPVIAAPTSSAAVTVTLDGVSYVNNGLVGFGIVPSDFKDSTGDTIGGFGSAIAFKPGTWKKNSDGTYSGILVGHPDRGYNVDTPIDYQSRRLEFQFTLKPYSGSSNLSFSAAQQTLKLALANTALETERGGLKTSGLDATAIRSAQTGYGSLVGADPDMPIPSVSQNRLTVDVEGLVYNADGTYWVSDEYGPYIYKFSADGQLLQTIQPPAAILPMKSGKLSFTSLSDPDTGRSSNQGFEGLTVDPVTGRLYAMLQSAPMQDGGSDKTTSHYTRLLSWDVSAIPKLVGEWIVPLPVSSDKGKTRESSEIHYVGNNVFLVLARDSDGRGGDDTKSKYKQIDLFSIAKATNIAGTKYDSPSNPVSPNGKLVSGITTASYVSFVNMIDSTQLKRFGLHNDTPDDLTLIDGKWESLALAPVDDPAYPDDYFLFTVADNDFVSQHGVSLGVPFNAGEDVDNQFLVFRVTLPSAPRGSVHKSIGIAYPSA